MAVPGWGIVAGLGAKLLDRFLDPRRKKEALLEQKRKLLAEPWTPARAHRLALLDERLLAVQRAIDRQAS